MRKIFVASTLVIFAATIGAVKLISIPSSAPASARSGPAASVEPPAVDTAEIMRTAPRNLPTETWSPI